MDDNFSDDVCHCKYCDAIVIMPFMGASIPISQKDYDEILTLDHIFLKFFGRNREPSTYMWRFVV